MTSHSSRLGLRTPPEEAPSVVAFPISRASDAVLIREVAAGREQAIAELFDRFDGLVRRMLTRTLGTAHEIDDLTQETFLTIIRRCATLRDVDALDSFVVGVAIRHARNELRKRLIRRLARVDSPIEELAAPARDPTVREGVQRLYRALDRLDATSRVLFVLRHVEGFELSELARAEGCSLATVKRRLARAERKFEAIAARDPVLASFLRRGS